MKTIAWKLMEPQDIEVRPQFFGNGEKDKLSLLLYQNARTAADAFDEEFGQFGWKCDYKAVGDKVYGCIAVYDEEKKDWIEKWDTGEESNISADKGQASDILKRAAVKWGYGRELYSAPKIKVDNDGYNCAGYKVSKIAYDENRRIIDLIITDRWGNIKWTMNSQKSPLSVANGGKYDKVSAPEKKSNFKILQEFCTKTGLECPECQAEVKEFFNYWKPKMETWKGKLDVEKLWNNRRARMETKPELEYQM